MDSPLMYEHECRDFWPPMRSMRCTSHFFVRKHSSCWFVRTRDLWIFMRGKKRMSNEHLCFILLFSYYILISILLFRPGIERRDAN